MHDEKDTDTRRNELSVVAISFVEFLVCESFRLEKADKTDNRAVCRHNLRILRAFVQVLRIERITISEQFCTLIAEIGLHSLFRDAANARWLYVASSVSNHFVWLGMQVDGSSVECEELPDGVYALASVTHISDEMLGKVLM